MKKQLLLLAMILLPLVASAETVEINGIYYNLVSKIQEAEVTSNPNKYTGSVVIPEKVTYESVEYSVTSIGERAFYECSGLTSITIPNSVTSIGERAFYECSGLTSITIPNSVTSIGDWAFFGCSGLKKVIVKDIAAWCGIKFEGSYSNPLYYARHIYSDEDTEITNLIIPNSVTSIGAEAFRGCSGLTSITIPNSVTSIGHDTFAGCSGLTSVTIPNSVTSIGNGAFRQCSGLTSITIPNSVTSIGYVAFDGVDIPTVISLIENPFKIEGKTSGSSTFSQNTFNNATLYVPKGTIDKYKATDGWKDFLFIEEGTGGGDTPTTQKCEKPTISYENGKLTFTSETEGVKFIYDIQANGSSSGEGNVLDLTPSFTVKVYASKEGYEDSDVATETINIIKGDTDGDGVVDIADAVRIVNFIVGKIPALAPRSELNLTEPE